MHFLVFFENNEIYHSKKILKQKALMHKNVKYIHYIFMKMILIYLYGIVEALLKLN